MYGYWSAITSTPASMAASIIASDWVTNPQAPRPDALWWEICTFPPVRCATRSVSATLSKRPRPSLRMWVA